MSGIGHVGVVHHVGADPICSSIVTASHAAGSLNPHKEVASTSPFAPASPYREPTQAIGRAIYLASSRMSPATSSLLGDVRVFFMLVR